MVLFSLVLMTYHGVVLLMSGYQADEEKILKQYREIVDVYVSTFSFFVLLHPTNLLLFTRYFLA